MKDLSKDTSFVGRINLKKTKKIKRKRWESIRKKNKTKKRNRVPLYKIKNDELCSVNISTLDYDALIVLKQKIYS